MRKIMLLLSVLSLTLLAGCDEPKPASIEDLGMINGCQVDYVNRGAEKHSFYMAKCPATSVTTTNRFMQSSGKSSSLKSSVLITQEIEELEMRKQELQNQKDNAQVMESALNKLSPEERDVLLKTVK